MFVSYTDTPPIIFSEEEEPAAGVPKAAAQSS
jgi:hypothetical protein